MSLPHLPTSANFHPSCNPDEDDFSDTITVNQVSRTMLKKNLEYKHIEMPQQSQAKGD